jgi:lipopolysaccharide/colanic/teichoic acid biosynthesis glycosyltransferase
MSQTANANFRDLSGGTIGTPGHISTRALDIAFAVTALVILLPALLVVVLAICIEDGWPVLFFQRRLGRNGRQFVLCKFRKFRRSQASPGCPLTVKGDARFTRVGRILERTKIDEIPQLWNILKGDMSLVGPRPETPNFADCFEGPCGELLRYKPGIFGPSQAVFRSEGELYEKGRDPEEFYRAVLFPLKARLDLAYFPNRNVRLDLRWIVRCVLAVLGLQFMADGRADLLEQVDCCLRLLTSEAKS